MLTNNNGGVKVSNEGYTYTKKCSNKSTIRRECSQSRGRSCKGALKGERPIGAKDRRANDRRAKDRGPKDKIPYRVNRYYNIITARWTVVIGKRGLQRLHLSMHE